MAPTLRSHPDVVTVPGSHGWKFKATMTGSGKLLIQSCEHGAVTMTGFESWHSAETWGTDRRRGAGAAILRPITPSVRHETSVGEERWRFVRLSILRQRRCIRHPKGNDAGRALRQRQDGGAVMRTEAGRLTLEARIGITGALFNHHGRK